MKWKVTSVVGNTTTTTTTKKNTSNAFLELNLR